MITLLFLVLAAACDREPKWTTGSGIQITEVREGEGNLPAKGDLMSILYTATFVGGRTFDTQLDPESPYRFRLGMKDVMAGLDEGVQTMRRGGKRIIVVPPELAYGKEGLPGTVPPNTSVRFEVELLEITPPPPYPQPWDEVGHEVFTAPSGLQIIDFVVGEGKLATPSSTVSIMYTAFLDDGTPFDTTHQRGVPLEFSLKDSPVIKGIYEALLSMREGGQRKIIVPPFLGYGEKGFREIVPPNATLIYDIELLEVK